ATSNRPCSLRIVVPSAFGAAAEPAHACSPRATTLTGRDARCNADGACWGGVTANSHAMPCTLAGRWGEPRARCRAPRSGGLRMERRGGHRGPPRLVCVVFVRAQLPGVGEAAAGGIEPCGVR